MRRKFLIISFLLILTGLSACQPKETNLSFKTIEQRNAFDTRWVYKHESPNLIVVSTLEESISLSGLITPAAKEQLQKVKYDAYFVIAVFQGRKPTTGYNVQIERITRKGNKVSVYAQFLEPQPDEAKADIETLPYQLVRVDKTGKWGQEVTFELIVKGAVVASCSQYIP
ncbi:protease complex subunit PrcB family protein [Roseiflexus sp.]|uniref:protease complex subunit PrcB family protein n=1 Tax=Roseiflexus sp. TaxID=2562120 RepID=UPI0021DD4F12|nr:protease complex subunit PrcB family protein [Roseiflexus sp.]GIV98816.1 MAG: hypothetical protein KatS3mg058_0220 [Roseiflexus sp.]